MRGPELGPTRDLLPVLFDLQTCSTLVWKLLTTNLEMQLLLSSEDLRMFLSVCPAS